MSNCTRLHTHTHIIPIFIYFEFFQYKLFVIIINCELIEFFSIFTNTFSIKILTIYNKFKKKEEIIILK